MPFPPPSMGSQATYRKRSWPAVSQIWSFTVFPPTLTTLDPNSTPMVWLESCLTGSGRERGGSAGAPGMSPSCRPPPQFLQPNSHCWVGRELSKDCPPRPEAKLQQQLYPSGSCYLPRLLPTDPHHGHIHASRVLPETHTYSQ